MIQPMEKIVGVFGVVGLWPVIVTGLAWVFVHFFRPQERRLRRLERLTALRNALGARGAVLDGDLEDLLARVAEDQKTADIRPWQWVMGVVGASGVLGGLWTIYVALTGTPQEMLEATGYDYRTGALMTSLPLMIATAIMTVLAVTTDIPGVIRSRARIRKEKRRQAAGPEGLTESDEPTD